MTIGTVVDGVVTSGTAVIGLVTSWSAVNCLVGRSGDDWDGSGRCGD